MSSVNIGRNSDTNDNLFTGAIDDVRIYNRALSERAVAAIAGAAGLASSPDESQKQTEDHIL